MTDDSSNNRWPEQEAKSQALQRDLWEMYAALKNRLLGEGFTGTMNRAAEDLKRQIVFWEHQHAEYLIHFGPPDLKTAEGKRPRASTRNLDLGD